MTKLMTIWPESLKLFTVQTFSSRHFATVARKKLPFNGQKPGTDPREKDRGIESRSVAETEETGKACTNADASMTDADATSSSDIDMTKSYYNK